MYNFSTMSKRKYVFRAIFTLYFLSNNGLNAANILAIFPTSSGSHFIVYGAILKELASRGHQITVGSLSLEPLSNTSNIKFIDIKNYKGQRFKPKYLTLDYLTNLSPSDGIMDIIHYSVNSCVKTFNSKTIRELENNKYDLLVNEFFGCDCFAALGNKLNIPIVGVTASVTLPWTTPIIGHYENPSYIPTYFSHYDQSMNLWQRFFNTLLSIYANLRFEIDSNMKIHEFVEEIIGKIPHLRSISNNVSLILTNSHFSLNHVKPMLPQLIEVGGLHIPKKIPPISQKLEEFYNQSKDGVILFTLGSHASTESIPIDKINIIVDVLGSLPYKVLWKINATGLGALPPNIMTIPWVEQLSALCDPRTKLFISHGGLLGMQEAMYCGVPVLGIPLFADQYMCLRSLQTKGAALMLYYNDITKEELTSKIYKLLNEESYKKQAIKLSNLFKDRPQHPLDAAVYWIEYVLRHKGAFHLKSPAQELTWYQYLLLDVFLILFIIIFTLIYIVKFIFCKLKTSFIKMKNE